MAVFCYLGSVLASLVVVFSGGVTNPPWSHQASWAVSWSASGALLVEVVAAGASAFICAQVAGSDNVARGRGLPRPLRLPASATALVTVTAWAGLLTVTAITYLMVWRNTGVLSAPSTWPLLATALAAVLLTAAAGAWAGCLWPHLLTPIGAAAAVFLVSFLGGGRAAALLGTTGNSASLAGMRANLGYVGLSLLALALLLVGGSAMGIAALSLSTRGRLAAAALGTALCATALAGPGRAAAAQEGMLVDDTIVADHCAERDGVQVCVAADAGLAPAAIREQIDPYLQVLRTVPVAVPSTFVQSLPASLDTETRASFVIDLDSLRAGRLTDQGAAAAVSTPSQCPQWSADAMPSEKAIRARDLLRVWLLTAVGRPPSADTAPAAERTWLASAGARQWVRATYPLLTDCRLDAVPSPTTYGLDPQADR